MTENTSAEDVLQSSELAARLLRRLITSPGVIDTQRLFKTYARLTELITHAHPLLQDLLSRYTIDDDSALQNLPLVTDQPWMLNLNTYLTNNSSVSSTTNNSYFATNIDNQSVLQSSTSLTTNTQLFGATSQTAPPEKFRVSRRGATDRPQSVRVDDTEFVLNPVPKRSEALTTSIVYIEPQPRTIANVEKSEPSKAAPLPITTPSETVAQTLPLASRVIQRESVETELKRSQLVLKESERIRVEKSAATVERVEKQNTTTTQSPLAETKVTATTVPTLPVVQAQTLASQFQTRSQQLVYRKSADSLTLRDLVSDLSTSGPLAAVRQALDSMPTTQSLPTSQITKPETAAIREDEPYTTEEITTEGMLRRISKMLLIERERRGY